MGYLLRSMALIGVIALNSPVHGTKPEAPAPLNDAKAALALLAGLDPKGAAHGATSLREAAEILAGLEPETRARFLALAAQTTQGSDVHKVVR